jgi:hypothetical protein
MKGRYVAVIASGLLLSACSAVGMYAQSTTFVGHSIEIKADYTFVYSSWSDEIIEGEDTSAISGTWAQAGRRTIVTTAAPSTDPNRLQFGIPTMAYHPSRARYRLRN